MSRLQAHRRVHATWNVLRHAGTCGMFRLPSPAVLNPPSWPAALYASVNGIEISVGLCPTVKSI